MSLDRRAARTGQDAPVANTATADAVRLLARRPLTEQELRQRLRSKGHPETEVDATVARMVERRYLDDESLALDYLIARSHRKGHGRGRLLIELERRGVARTIAHRAWTSAVERGEIDPDALIGLRLDKEMRRLETPLDQRGYRRVYNALLRSGFDRSAVVAALAPHRPTADADPD